MKRPFFILMILPAVGLIGLGFFYPLITMLIEGLFQPLTFSLWGDPYTWRILIFTYLQAIISAAFAGVLGTTGAIIYSEQRFFWRRLLWQLGLLAFSLPPLLAVMGFLGVWGNRGWLVQAMNLEGRFDGYGLFGIFVVHAFLNFSIFTRYVGTSLLEMDRLPERSALALGASRLRIFISVTGPKLFPAFRSAFLLSFLYCSSSFLVVLMLGGGPRYSTVEVAIYEAVKMNLNQAVAVRFALVHLAVTGLVFLALFRSRCFANEARSRDHFPLFLFWDSRKNQWVRVAYFLVLSLLVLFPLASLFGSGIWNLRELPHSDLFQSVATSLSLGLTVASLASISAFGLAYGSAKLGLKKSADWMASVPLCVSGVLFSLALMVSFPFLLSLGRQYYLGVLWAQTLMAFPLVFRAMRDAVESLDPKISRTALSLGASPLKTLLWIELPLLRRAIAVGFLFALTLSLGEVGSLLMFVPSGAAPLSLSLFRAMSQYRFGEAFSWGLVLLVLVTLAETLMMRIENEPKIRKS